MVDLTPVPLSPGHLLRNFEARDENAATVTSEAGQNHSAGESTQQAVARGKRVVVSAACQRCREKKIKCDALRPCSACAKKQLECQYETGIGETHSQATKRKYDEMAEAHDNYAEIYDMIRTRDPRQVSELVHRIRNGHSPELVLRSMKTSDLASAAYDPKRHALEVFLVNLAHSTGSLQDITRLAASILYQTTRDLLPTPEDFLVLRNRIVHLPYVESLLRRKNQEVLSIAGITNSSDGQHSASSDSSRRRSSSGTIGEQSKDNEPLYQVPAEPWASLTASDEAVSHLVSLFFAWINPTWRFIERDLFLQGMRSKWLVSDFCSPFLVNSICAIASLHSEHEVAFSSQDRDRITRGQHFHDEALRLWVLEESRPTLTNIQALCILSLESNYRAKDRLGLTLIPIAVQLNNELPVHANAARCASQGVSVQDFARARLAAHWTAKCTHIIMRIAFMSPITITSRLTGLPRIYDVFDDHVEPWVGYPFDTSVIPSRPTLYLVERCKLAELLQDMHNLIFAPEVQRNTKESRHFAKALDDLVTKMQRWYQRLPFELHYEWPMTVSVWELHASYLASLMILWCAAKSRFEKDQEAVKHMAPRVELDDGFESEMAQVSLSNAIVLAHRAATILRDFRERYGLKITPAWLLQLQAVTAGVLMLDPELADPSTVSSSAAKELDTSIQDSHAAFDEVFRCLLGTGVEVMIARGIARMMYHTALERKIALSRSTRSMLQIMSSTAWRPSDLSLVNSAFPNYAASQGHEDSERLSELLLKWERLEI